MSNVTPPATPRRISRWAFTALVLSCILVAGTAVATALELGDRSDATRQLDRAHAALGSQQVRTERADAQLRQTRAELKGLEQPAEAALADGQHLVELQDQLLSAVQDAVRAGEMAAIGDYNRAIERANRTVGEFNTVRARLGTGLATITSAVPPKG